MNQPTIAPIETVESQSGGRPEPFYVNLVISDPEVVLAAGEYAEGRARTDSLLTA